MNRATIEIQNTENITTKEQVKNPFMPVSPNPLPRSVQRKGRYSLLDGPWRFAFDPEDHGLEQAWYLGHDYSLDINLPCDIKSYLGDIDTGKLNSLVAWYERDFVLPEDWEETFTADKGNLLQLVFGACGYETRFWVNGQALRTIEGSEVHRGEYTLFSCEVPLDLLNPCGAPNHVTIRTADSLDPDLPRGKQQSNVNKRGGIWYQTISGPVRSIWIEPVPANRLRCKLEVHPGDEEGLVEFTLTTHVRDAGNYVFSLQVFDPFSGESREGSAIASAQVVTSLKPGEARHQDRPQRPWCPTLEP